MHGHIPHANDARRLRRRNRRLAMFLLVFAAAIFAVFFLRTGSLLNG